jgi:hypothetical protein
LNIAKGLQVTPLTLELIMKTWPALTALAFLAALGCKKDEDKTTTMPQGSLGNQSYYVVESSDLELGENALQGSGSIIFASPLNTAPLQDNFALEFTVEEGGSMALVARSDGSLAHGLTVQFERSGTQLIASLKADGSGTADHILDGVDASGLISLAIDVHNNENPAHVLIWNAALDAFGEEDALYNSEEDADAPGVGKGSLWGLVLRDAEIKAATRGAAKFTEE